MPPPAAHPPTLGSASLAINTQASKDRARAAEGLGANDTVQTSSQGLKPSATAKTLLGD